MIANRLLSNRTLRSFPKAYVHGQNSSWNDCIRPVSIAECAAMVLTCSTLSAVYEVT
jgi:hypothetical protein